MADEGKILDCHSFADESMAGDLAVLAHLYIFLDLDERSNLRIVSNFAAVEIDEFRQHDAFSELYVGGNAAVVVHRRTIFPLSWRDSSAASSIWTTRMPAAPSLNGDLSLRIQSAKYPSSDFSASACSTRGAHISPER